MLLKVETFKNPFRPGAGHVPPHLAGRKNELEELNKALTQDVILENIVLTGLRGTGKTVLLEYFKPQAIASGWKWAGADLSEAATVSEQNIVLRLLADLSIVTSNIVVQNHYPIIPILTETTQRTDQTLNYSLLSDVYSQTPGLVLDKLKFVLEFAWSELANSEIKGLVFAYDEAQNLSDHAVKDEYPLSVLLDTFQSLQRKGLPLILLLSGLPTLSRKLADSRTYSERMFHNIELSKLSPEACRDAIKMPIKDEKCPVECTPENVEKIIELSGGYPYFIQFICKEYYDAYLQGARSVPINEINKKLDADFFVSRWGRTTDRQRDLLTIISALDTCDNEFTVREIVEKSEEKLDKPFGASQTNQMLRTLEDSGLVFKNRYGKYALAVPLLASFILRETAPPTEEKRRLSNI